MPGNFLGKAFVGGAAKPNGPLWTPAEITVSLWLDASDSETITIDTGVSVWADKSGNNNNFTQGTPSNQPSVISSGLNGLNVIRFDGIDDRLLALTPANLLANDPKTIFIVYIHSGSGANMMAMSTRINYGGVDNSLRGYIFRARALNDFDYSHAGVGNYIGSSTLEADTAYILHVESAINATSVALWLNENIETPATDTISTANIELANGYTSIGVQSTEYSGGDLAEILAFPGTPSEANRYNIGGYLAWKWGLENGLPIGHPYKNRPPRV